MAAKFKRGDVVALTAVVPTGPILSMRMDEEGNVQYLVEWNDADGNTQQRWFDEDKLTGA
jgi:uncharacterized protein YodC (DUF2158 family)